MSGSVGEIGFGVCRGDDDGDDDGDVCVRALRKNEGFSTLHQNAGFATLAAYSYSQSSPPLCSGQEMALIVRFESKN